MKWMFVKGIINGLLSSDIKTDSLCFSNSILIETQLAVANSVEQTTDYTQSKHSMNFALFVTASLPQSY